MKLKPLIIVFIFIVCGNCNSSTLLSDYLNIELTFQIKNPRMNSINYTYYNGELFEIKDTLQIKKITSLNDNKVSFMYIPDSVKNYPVENISIGNRYWIYSDWEKLNIYELKDSQLKYKESLKLGISIENIQQYENKVYIQSARITSNNLSNDTHSVVVKIDIEKNKIEILDLKDPEGFGFSFYSPKNNIEFDDSLIYVANFTTYRVDVYNWQGNRIDSFGRIPEKWINYKGHIPEYPKGSVNPGLYLNELNPITRKQSIINKLYFIDLNKLLVGWTKPINDTTMYDYMFDIWQKNNNGSWEIYKQDLSDYSFESNDNLNEKSFKLGYNFKVANGHILAFNVGNKELFENSKGIPYKDYKVKLDDYMIENPIQYLLGVFKIKK